MLSHFHLSRRFQPLAFLLVSMSCFGFSPVALSLTPEETQAFSTNYLKGCLQGMQQFSLDPEIKQQFCQCTLTNLLKLPDEKIRSFSTVSDEQLAQDVAINGAVTSCSQMITPKNMTDN